nr:mitochondrial thiamine pyrophosphate transporter [Polyrhizophydium stewartii]
MSRLPAFAQTFVAGSLSGAAATFSTYPLDLLRTRFAVQNKDQLYKSLYGAVREILAKEGVAGFYRGIVPSLVQIVPQMGLVFESHRFFRGLFDRLKSVAPAVHERTQGAHELVCGGLAGIVSKTAVMPFDVIRKRYQVQGPVRNAIVVEGVPRYQRGLVATALQIARHEGVLGLYKGLVPCLVKAAPSSAVTFFVMAECRRFFDNSNSH